jgi:hypothetical protein
MAYSKAQREKILGRIVDALKKGHGKLKAARHGGINPDTMYDWVKKHPEFSEAIKSAEDEFLDNARTLAISTILKSMQDGTWTAAAWWLERRYKEEFGAKIIQQHEGSAENPVVTQRKADYKEIYDNLSADDKREFIEMLKRAKEKKDGKGKK